jgi:hypothetical protein
MHIVLVTVAGCAAALPAANACAQPVTTVITHGYSTSTTTKSPWIEAMADAIIARASGGGCVCRYDDASGGGTGAWRVVSGSLDPQEPVVLIVRWLNDFEKSGPDWGYAEGAADALHAALRDARFNDASGRPIAGFDLVAGRHLHFIGHSRGPCVNSEIARRLAQEGITVDHVTTMDPHPVNGTLDAPYDLNWGDPVPRTWSNVTFADNVWRADGGGFINGLDFDGIVIAGAVNTQLSETALNCCAYSFAHSDVHLWYHGTIDLAPPPGPCDGEQCFNATMRSMWYPDGYTERGFFYSRLGGGWAARPAGTSGIAPGSVPSLYGGTFDQASLAGWLYHGGLMSGSVVSEGGRTYLRLGAGTGPSAVHNRFLLPENAALVRLSYRIITADAAAGDDVLALSLIDRDGNIVPLANPLPLAGPAGSWISGHEMAIPPAAQRGRAQRLRLDVSGGAAVAAVVGVDDLEMITGPPPIPGDLDGDGDVDVADLLDLLAAWGSCPQPCPFPGACPADLDGTCAVNVSDLLMLLANWG